MAALPYMPLFVADYLADTAHLTTQQHGAYLLLIMNYWQRGAPLPDDDARLAKIARVGPREWSRMRDTISEFFSIADGTWLHSRIASELARVSDKSLKSKKAAQASVQRRFGERSAPVEPTDTQAQTRVPLDKSNGGDPDKILWDSAKAFLKPERADPGSLIGKWCRDFGKEATAQALTKAQLERPAQRIPFVEACLRKAKQEHGSGWDFMP